MQKILILEDDPNIAHALAIRLLSAGYEPAIACDALAAVQTAVRLKPDLVLLDITMPAGDGFTVVARLQTVLEKPTPVIFLTASKQPGLRDKAAELGAAGYFEKPFEAGELLTSIRQTLGSGP